MGLATITYNIYTHFILLLKAPLFEVSMWWIISPLIVTFLVMTVYFGMYRKEELGWNSALSNVIVLLFVSIDLLRTIYNYTIPPSTNNYLTNQVLTAVIFIIILEAILLFWFAFNHTVPKKFMFFIAAPLCINIQAYVIVSLVYLKALPNKYTILAALLLFFVLFGASQLLRVLEKPLMLLRHKTKLRQARKLRRKAKHFHSQSLKAKGWKSKILSEEAKISLAKARKIEHHLKSEEKEEFGELKIAKELKKPKDKKGLKKSKKRHKRRK